MFNIIDFGPKLHKASIQLKVPGTSCYPVLSQFKHFLWTLEDMLVPVLYRFWDHYFSWGHNNFNDLKDMKIATLNVRTLKDNYRINILSDNFGCFKLIVIKSFRNSYPRGREHTIRWYRVYLLRKEGWGA